MVTYIFAFSWSNVTLTDPKTHLLGDKADGAVINTDQSRARQPQYRSSKIISNDYAIKKIDGYHPKEAFIAMSALDSNSAFPKTYLGFDTLEPKIDASTR